MKTNIALSSNEDYIQSFPLRLWGKYKYFVENATKGSLENDEGDIGFWRQKLFTSFIIYFMPISLVAVVPGVFMSLKEGNLVIAGFDLLAAGSIIIISLSIKLNIIFRKAFVIGMLYAVAVFFLIYLGLYGPGLVYLLAISTFIALSFSRAVAYSSIIVNLLICIFVFIHNLFKTI